MKKYYAHSTDSEDKSDWQLLHEHLSNVAELSGNFGEVFDASGWTRCAGLLHDTGKATKAFQRRLEGSCDRVDHSTFGARVAWKHCGNFGILLSYVIAGHHGGLPDGGEQKGQLHYRLKHSEIPDDARLLPGVDCTDNLSLPFKLSRDQKWRAGFVLSFFTRMVFSSLVDADFLDTEHFFSKEKAEKRKRQLSGKIIHQLRKQFIHHMELLGKMAEKTDVNCIRGQILRECLEKAALSKQFFSLKVPTGGGKTLSSMGFALEHATRHNMNRIIYTIPFTSIIEQNAGVFKDIFGKDVVLEHHSNLIESDDREDRNYNLRQRLAMENWDMPVVVTTNVQFFESLFACKTSRCRKLHNIAGSVIVLDEAQAIPTRYLKPCLMALRELVDHYGCSVVLCTATQPALDDMHALGQEALTKVTEIINDPDLLFNQLKRANVQFIGKKSNSELADLMKKEQQVLCIVSTKKQAQDVFQRLPSTDGIFHLSTNMYPLHRQQVLQEIRQQLKTGKPCRVVSTSLVEAGVDIDFPVVYRAMAGLDSIAQAAGRCNREGRLNKLGTLGQVYVFEPETLPSMPWLKRCISRGKEALRSLPDKDPLGTEVIRHYFELLYDVEDLDDKQIMSLLNPVPDRDLLFLFREAADNFRFIEEDTADVIIPVTPETDSFIRELRYSEFTRSTFRKLQPYTVSVRRNDLQTLIAEGGVEVINDEFYVLCNKKAYSKEMGLLIDNAGTWNVEDLITY